MGIFYGGHGQLLLCNFIAVVVNISWVVSWIPEKGYCFAAAATLQRLRQTPPLQRC